MILSTLLQITGSFTLTATSHPQPPVPPPSLPIPFSSRYTLWNFLPLFLVEAFTRMANAYFLMVCILQSIPEISITNGVPTSFLPLGIVLIFDGFATAREDYKRHVDDHRANNTQSECDISIVCDSPHIK